MKYALSLIDRAKELCGSYAEVGRRIDLAESHISQFRKGKRDLPPDCVPILADMLGLDVDETIHRVILDNAKGTKREAILKEVLGKAIAAGVAGMCLFSYSADSISAVRHRESVTYSPKTLHVPIDRLHIVFSTLRRFLARLLLPQRLAI